MGGKAGAGGRGGAIGISHGSGDPNGVDPAPTPGLRGENGLNAEAGIAGLKGVGSGGGISAFQGTLIVTQATIVNNAVTDDGGGLATLENTLATIHNSTIYGNHAGAGGGGIYAVLNDAQNPVSVISTIIAGNAAPIGADVSGSLDITFSLIQKITDAVLNGSNNLTNVSPLLGKLGFYGSTVATMSPLTGSPALDHGSNPDALATDARGKVRVLGAAIDIGAVEAR